MGVFLKDLVPLAAIGCAYVWRDGPSDRHAHALAPADARIPHQIDYEHEQEQEWKGPGVELPPRTLTSGCAVSCKALRECVLTGFPDQGRIRSPCRCDRGSGQRPEVRSPTSAPFRIARLDLANASPARTWRPVARNIKPGSQLCKNRPIFEAATATGLLACFLNASTKRCVDTADLKLVTQSTLNIDLTPVFEGLDNSCDDQRRLRDGSSDVRQS
jgi:hypothetical protein